MKFLQSGEFAMPLRRGEMRGFDFNRMIVEFTVFNQDQVMRSAPQRWMILKENVT